MVGNWFFGLYYLTKYCHERVIWLGWWRDLCWYFLFPTSSGNSTVLPPETLGKASIFIVPCRLNPGFNGNWEPLFFEWVFFIFLMAGLNPLEIFVVLLDFTTFGELIISTENGSISFSVFSVFSVLFGGVSTERGSVSGGISTDRGSLGIIWDSDVWIGFLGLMTSVSTISEGSSGCLLRFSELIGVSVVVGKALFLSYLVGLSTQ